MFILLFLATLGVLGCVITSMWAIPKLSFDVKEILDFNYDKSLIESLMLVDILCFSFIVILLGITGFFIYYVYRIEFPSEDEKNENCSNIKAPLDPDEE